TGATTAPSSGDSTARAAVNAAAEAACPDGKDDDSGGVLIRRWAATRSAGGRRRGSSGLPTRFVAVLTSAIEAAPRSAARRVRPLRVARRVAAPSHNPLRSAPVPSALSSGSEMVGRRVALRWDSARSARRTRSITLCKVLTTLNTVRAAQTADRLPAG